VTKLLALCAAMGMTAWVTAAAPAPLKTQKEKVSYCIGLNIGKGMKAQQFDLDPDILVRGIKDALSGATPALTDDQIRAVLTAFEQDARSRHESRLKAAADKNQADGKAFLAANGAKADVKTTPSGLQYKILKAGTGPRPKATDTVVTHYRGTLLDGTEFDSSHKRGEPAEFPVNGVIRGWTEALQLMKVGAKWQLVVPSDLAYGPRGAGRRIGPNATLIFEVELLKIK